MVELARDLWPHLASFLAIAGALLASAHVLLSKDEVGSAIGWVGIVWLVPFVGMFLYVVFGINRIRRRALTLRGRQPRQLPAGVAAPPTVSGLGELAPLAQVVNHVTEYRLLPGNRIVVLRGGDTAYPAMLEAIEGAEHTITLATYIFDNDSAGREFAEALGRAVRRGVSVRVLIDDAGARYSAPPITRRLRRQGVRVARFLPAWRPWGAPFLNLRNHRKICVIDGRTGFTGGINVREGCRLSRSPKHPVDDLHFLVSGPVTGHLQQVFAEDWEFATREPLRGPEWFPRLDVAGKTIARGIPDGPDEDFDKVRWTLLGALGCARRSVRIMTPYFLPDSDLMTALGVAALRGVDVDVLIPERTNIPLVRWAMWAQLHQVLDQRCRVHLGPLPFDHSKLMVVDDTWSLVGSANWDARSLRLNFEFVVECYDPELARELAEEFDARVARGRRVARRELDARPLPRRVRDALAWLASPYL